MTDKDAALEWARKVIKSKPPRYTDASRNAAAAILADAKIIKAAEELLADVKARYPGEELRCKYMIALDAAVSERDT